MPFEIIMNHLNDQPSNTGIAVSKRRLTDIIEHPRMLYPSSNPFLILIFEKQNRQNVSEPLQQSPGASLYIEARCVN